MTAMTTMIAEVDGVYHVLVMGEDECFRKIPNNNGWKYLGWAKAELNVRRMSGDFTTPNTPVDHISVYHSPRAATAPKTEAVREAAAALGIQCVDVKGATDDLGCEQVQPE